MRKKLLARVLAGLAVIGILVLCIALIAHARNNMAATTSCPFRVPSSTLSSGRTFNSQVDRGDCIRLGRASSTQDLQQGLSGRDFMPQDEGLLFVFSGSGSRCMWMKDMRINLDIIWLDATKTIRHIETDLRPNSYPKSYCGNGDASYVIELNSGMTTAAKLKIGQQLNF